MRRFDMQPKPKTTHNNADVIEYGYLQPGRNRRQAWSFGLEEEWRPVLARTKQVAEGLAHIENNRESTQHVCWPKRQK